jgi:hypothetical protein
MPLLTTERGWEILRRRQALEFKRLMQRHGGQKRLPSAASRATDRQRDTFEAKEAK